MDIIHPGDSFRFPPNSSVTSADSGHASSGSGDQSRGGAAPKAGKGAGAAGQEGEKEGGEPSPISKVDRSNSTPNVSHTIIQSAMAGGESTLPLELFKYLFSFLVIPWEEANELLSRHQKKDVRTQGMVPLNELFLPAPSSSQAKGSKTGNNNQSSPNKSSRSVSSSPTSTLRTPR